MPLAQTVTIVNKSGKVVKTSKSLGLVWKEAQSAYRERKAEIKAIRKADVDERQERRALNNLDAEPSDRRRDRRRGRDDGSASSSRRSSVQSTSTRSESTVRQDSAVRRKPVPSSRPRAERHDSGGSTRSSRSGHDAPPSPRKHGRSKLRFEDSLANMDNDDESQGRELVRRNTDGMIHLQDLHTRPRSPSRTASMTELEESLAYGELPDAGTLTRPSEENELRNQVTKLQQLLDEANCVQHSVVAMIETLQKNPDQLAAVGLTLAEISTLASKMAPAALTSLKTAAPAVFALLASPQFMIAAGVGVGVTVIAIGGYKIIKKIKKDKSDKKSKQIDDYGEDDEDDDELQEIRSDLSRIEIWRRGIADAQNSSTGTSIDGELITPYASRQLIEQGKMRESDLKSTKSSKTKKSTKSKQKGKERGKDKEKDKEKQKIKDKKKESDDEGSVLDRGKALIKDPNGIRSLFKRDTKRPAPSLA